MAPHETRSGAAWLACAEPAEVDEFLDGLSENALLSLPWLFEFWALPHQLPPEGDWKSWVIMGGRGAGKTRAGSEWVRRMVEGPTATAPGRCHRLALLGETYEQAREVMVMGESGILACSPPDRRPAWEAGRRRLVWANGATATVYSAHDYEALRGPQFDGAWVDELAKWQKAEEAWDMLQFALRLGEHPQQVVTTTPKNIAVLKRILTNASTVTTHAPTDANRAYLAESFLTEVAARYGGTRQGRQELEGVLLDDVEGALWSTAMLEACRVERAPKLSRVVVAVDPAVTAGRASDECGIVVAGVVSEGEPGNWRGYVLEDATVKGSPMDWARAAIAAMDRHGAERLVAEVNQGGDLVEQVIRQVDPLVPFRGLRAGRGKGLRAEPVAALYEQGRVKHLRGGNLGALEDQLTQMTVRGFEGRGSPDRLDALVWAMHELMIEPAAGYRRPQVRGL
ncbi:terminase family protein [uncultured Paracoccus sp.]|uniref:DNA-packaging protein n=1 Tax=uncultured Paracoccus sp. TaxID=189685 RepID=UPI00260C28D0|nr:terminase family protein [uncultured Paracoccus sp.]